MGAFERLFGTPKVCASRRWRRRPESITGECRPPLILPKFWRSHPMVWSSLRRVIDRAHRRTLTTRSLRSQPRSDLASGSHVVLVVFQHAASCSRAQLGGFSVHCLREPQLRVQPSWIVVAPAESHMPRHQLEPEPADAEIVGLDDLQQIDEMLFRVRRRPIQQLGVLATGQLDDLGDFVRAVVEDEGRRRGVDDAA